jgi:hypothetical protein
MWAKNGRTSTGNVFRILSALRNLRQPGERCGGGGSSSSSSTSSSTGEAVEGTILVLNTSR